MKAGTLNKRIEIQEPVEAEKDSLGQPVINWLTIASVWASIEPISAQERLQGGQFQAELTHKIRIRYREGVTSQCRIKYKDRMFDVRQPPINSWERNKEIVFLCVEKTQ